MKVASDVPGMRAEEDSFIGVRGLRIHARTWLPAGPPTGVVVIAHGFAEHGGRYAAVAARLVAEGIAVRAADHRGHGLSEGRRTSVVRFDDYVDDLTTVDRAGTCTLAVAASGAARSQHGRSHRARPRGAPNSSLDGLVLSAPAACPREVSTFTLAVGRALSRIAPNTGVLRLPLNRISRDAAVVDAYNNDPLVFRTPIRARLGAEMLDAMARVEAGLPSLRIPLLVMQGTADGLVDPGCGPHVYDRAGSTDKTLKMYDGLWHEIFNEPERDHVLGDLTAWLRPHLG